LSDQHKLLDQKLNQASEMLHSLPDRPDDEIRLLLITVVEADEILLHHLGTTASRPLRFDLSFSLSLLTAYEEDLVIPYLLAMSADDFHSLSSRL
jgi:hypothetical protein